MVLLELVQKHLLLHLAHLADRFGRVDVEPRPPAYGDCLEVGEVEDYCCRDGDHGDGAGSRGARRAGEGGFCEEGFGVAELGAVWVVVGWAEVVGPCELGTEEEEGEWAVWSSGGGGGGC